MVNGSFHLKLPFLGGAPQMDQDYGKEISKTLGA